MQILTVQLPLLPALLPPSQWGEALLWEKLPFQLHEIIAGREGDLVIGAASVAELPGADRLRLLVPACDVSLISVSLPALSPSKLKQALPHAVEDHLLQDPQECHFAVSAPGADGALAVAVMDRAWLQAIVDQFYVVGAGTANSRYAEIQIIPAQLDLPWPPSADNAHMTGVEADFPASSFNPACRLRSVRTGALSGYGLRLGVPGPHAASADLEWPLHSQQFSSDDLMQRRAVGEPALNLCQFDFAHVAQSASRLSWKTWRWPAYLAIALVVLQCFAVLAQVGVLNRESTRLRGTMAEALHSVLPNEPVVDALLQLRRHVEQLRMRSGKLAAEDFTVQADRLAQVMQGQAPDTLQGLQYKQGTLTIQLKAGTNTGALSEKAAQMGMRLQPDGVTSNGSSLWRFLAHTEQP